MVMQLVDNGVVRIHDGPGGWHVTVIECANGLANVESRRGVTQIFVADMPFPGGNEPNCFAAAACTPEGDALVVARHAPPALLVTAQGHRPTPGNPEKDELLHMADGERLLLLSAAAFEAIPRSLARVLHGPPEILLSADPVELLTELFDDIGSGSGAIISRDAQRAPLSEDLSEGRL